MTPADTSASTEIDWNPGRRLLLPLAIGIGILAVILWIFWLPIAGIGVLILGIAGIVHWGSVRIRVTSDGTLTYTSLFVFTRSFDLKELQEVRILLLGNASYLRRLRLIGRGTELSIPTSYVWWSHLGTVIANYAQANGAKISEPAQVWTGITPSGPGSVI